MPVKDVIKVMNQQPDEETYQARSGERIGASLSSSLAFLFVFTFIELHTLICNVYDGDKNKVSNNEWRISRIGDKNKVSNE